MTMPIARILEAFPDTKATGKRQWMARCKAHVDHTPSLSITEKADGKVVIYCHAGCSQEAAVTAAGLTMLDLFPPDIARTSNGRREEVARYTYTDEQSHDLFQVRRYLPKGFAQFSPDGNGGWKPGLNGARRVPFHLPHLLKGIADGRGVFIPEGERDVTTLEEGLGLVATTNAGGAEKWRAEFAPYFAGAKVYILPDNDDVGREHAEMVSRSLYGKTKEVRIISLPGLAEHGDVTDWVRAGGTVEQLKELARAAPLWQPDTSPSPERKPAPQGLVCLADVEPETLEWLWDGRIPLGKLTLIEGHPGTGKSHLTLELAARLSTGQPLPGGQPREPCNVVLVGVEDGLGDTVRPRLDAAGADVTRVFALRGFGDDDGGTLRPLSLPEDVGLLVSLIAGKEAKVLILDPLNAFLGERVDSYKDQDIRRALSPLAEMADRTGVTVICVRHLTKSAGGRAITAGGGSIAIVGVVRSALLVSEDPDNPERRVVAQVKNNLAKLAPSLAFRLESAEPGGSRLKWDGTSDHTADSLIAAGQEQLDGGPGQLDQAKGLLREWLKDAPMTRQELERKAKTEGISTRTLQRAKLALSIKHDREGFGPDSRTIWQLPHSRQTTNNGALGASGDERTTEHIAIDGDSHSRQAIPAKQDSEALARVADGEPGPVQGWLPTLTDAEAKELMRSEGAP